MEQVQGQGPASSMRIGELATRAGCDVQTVRFYERKGLLEEPSKLIDEVGIKL